MASQIGEVASASMIDDGDDSDSGTKPKSLHSIVEKKRRDKMTQYVADLSSMIPICGAMHRKLDKITVLRMAVQHLKAIKGSTVNTNSTDDSLFDDENVMKAIIETSNCFLFVVACDRGKFLYVSESVSNFMQCNHSDLIGQSIFDLLHPKDVQKVKEQLIASDFTAREIFIDSKTLEPVDPLVVPKPEINVTSSGAARSFFCRMKSLQPSIIKTEPEQVDTRRKKQSNLYLNIHCAGFLKTWASAKLASGSPENADSLSATSDLACLVAVARKPSQLCANDLERYSNINMNPIQFYMRLNYEYEISFVDPLVTYVTGFLPQETVGCSIFEFISEGDTNQLKDLLKMSSKTSEKIVSPILSLRTNNDAVFIPVRMVISMFRNPLSGDLEHTLLDITAVSTNSIHTPSEDSLMNPPTLPVPGSPPNQSIFSSTHSVSCYGGSNTSTEWDEAQAEASRAIIMSYLEADGGLADSSINLLNFPFS